MAASTNTGVDRPQVIGNRGQAVILTFLNGGLKVKKINEND